MADLDKINRQQRVQLPDELCLRKPLCITHHQQTCRPVVDPHHYRTVVLVGGTIHLRPGRQHEHPSGHSDVEYVTPADGEEGRAEAVCDLSDVFQPW